MAKARDKIQQIGFWDAEVSTPDHDAVCLWAYENADLIFREVYPELFDCSWQTKEVCDGYWDRYGRTVEGSIELAKNFAKANPRPNPRVFKKTLEYVLKSYTGYQDKMERIVGYADLLIQTELPCVTPTFKTRGEDDVFDGFRLGWTSERQVHGPWILVEAKSVLPTVGELMRQIQLYRTAFRGEFVVVSPDDRYAKILAEQDIVFVKYPH